MSPDKQEAVDTGRLFSLLLLPACLLPCSAVKNALILFKPKLYTPCLTLPAAFYMSKQINYQSCKLPELCVQLTHRPDSADCADPVTSGMRMLHFFHTEMASVVLGADATIVFRPLTFRFGDYRTRKPARALMWLPPGGAFQ